MLECRDVVWRFVCWLRGLVCRCGSGSRWWLDDRRLRVVVAGSLKLRRL